MTLVLLVFPAAEERKSERPLYPTALWLGLNVSACLHPSWDVWGLGLVAFVCISFSTRDISLPAANRQTAHYEMSSRVG